MKSAPNARARFSCGKENNCLSEGLYTKERFCYDKENQQLTDKNVGLKIRGRQCGMWKSSRIYKNGGEKDVQSEQGIEQ